MIPGVICMTKRQPLLYFKVLLIVEKDLPCLTTCTQQQFEGPKTHQHTTSAS